MTINEKIGKLGFGLMRLPMKDGAIDVEQVKTMVDMFMDAGYNYFDTAWAYAGSEDAIRQALVERYPRGRFLLATKNAAWINCKTREEAIGQFETSLKQTSAGYFDFYLLHNLGESRTHVFDDFGLWDFVREMKEQGKIRHYGFSAHCTADELDRILTAHPDAEFVQLQVNYADWESHSIQSRRCMEVAAKHGKPVIIMEPVKGGMLANPPEAVKKVFEAAEPGSTPSSWALRFAAGLDNVLTVLSGMSNVQQMEENLETFGRFQELSTKDKAVLDEARGVLEGIPLVQCTSCDYCAKVCPKNIGISGTLYAKNMLTLYRDRDAALHQEGWLVGGHGNARANECIRCRKCEDACPQHLPIVEELQKAVAELGI